MRQLPPSTGGCGEWRPAPCLVGGACLEGGRAGPRDCRLSGPLQLAIALGIPSCDMQLRYDTGGAAPAAAAARVARYFMRE